MIASILSNLRNTVIAGFVLAFVVFLIYLTQTEFNNYVFWPFLVRWFHIISGIMWIGMLWYFNFVQTPTMPKIPDEAPFSHIKGDRSNPRKVDFANITDGTSNTLLMSECLKAWTPLDHDWRGDIHNDDGEFRFHTKLTPNTSARDVFQSGWFEDTGDPKMPIVAGGAQVCAARSRHSRHQQQHTPQDRLLDRGDGLVAAEQLRRDGRTPERQNGEEADDPGCGMNSPDHGTP